jgi:hypothetical protein
MRNDLVMLAKAIAGLLFLLSMGFVFGGILLILLTFFTKPTIVSALVCGCLGMFTSLVIAGYADK